MDILQKSIGKYPTGHFPMPHIKRLSNPEDDRHLDGKLLQTLKALDYFLLNLCTQPF